MNRGLYRKLAFNNIKKNSNTFLPFSLSGIAMTAMFYMLYSIRVQAEDNTFFGARTMREILGFGIVVCGIVAVFVLFYTNSFLMKRRTKEFGLYSILGMEKKHIAKVVFWEIAMVGAFSIIAGLLAGMLFSKLMFMVLLRMLQIETDFAFGISVAALRFTFVLFAGTFAFIMIVNAIRIALLKPMDLMRSEKAGEREPKAKWLLALLGVVSLLIGYYLALSVDNPVKAIGTFFIAVLFVIAGTYLVFISGSIALLKILKKNKNYYYQKNHFITVSGMMYRMKQNAAGLSTICVLSTAVLVVISGTVSLYVGTDDSIRSRYPKDVMTTYLYEKDRNEDAEWEGGFPYHYNYSVLTPAISKCANKYHVAIKDIQQYYSFSDYGHWEHNQYTTTDIMSLDTEAEITVFILEDYNTFAGEEISLKDGEVLAWFSDDIQLEGNTIDITGKQYQIAKVVKEIPFPMPYGDNFGQICLIVSDFEALKEIRDIVNESYRENEEYDFDINISYNYNFDLKGSAEDKEVFCTNLRDEINKTKIAHLADVLCIDIDRKDFYAIYGSLFFVGIFIGTIFLITTVMIIYYKQISEGFDDRERFVILQKVGMSKKEVKSVIRSQILLVFFLPILLAVIHICFAFNIIREMLVLLELTNVALFIGCTVATIAVFAIVYAIVYSLTAKTYYRITYSN